MKKYIVGFLLVLLSMNLSAQDWVKEKNKDGITIYTKHDPKYAMKASRAEMYVAAPVDKVLNAIFDVKEYVNWMPDCTYSKVLKSISSDEFIYHAIYSTPWPAASRDLVLHIKKVAFKDGYKIIMTNKSNFIEVRKDAVRVPIYFGEWVLTKTDKGTKVFIEYQTDPGGSVPDWMIQGAAIRTPFDMMESLKHRLN
ncbi:MAG: hypothetical protein H6579_09490 [Chitinophagales bacterium]|nr:hypothetical protein [Chitinophagales bacterium]